MVVMVGALPDPMQRLVQSEPAPPAPHSTIKRKWANERAIAMQCAIFNIQQTVAVQFPMNIEYGYCHAIINFQYSTEYCHAIHNEY